MKTRNEIIERMRNLVDGIYTNAIIWNKDSEKKTELLEKRESLRDNRELLKELKDIRALIDLGTKALEQDLELKEMER